jgi:hypothetical protein
LSWWNRKRFWVQRFRGLEVRDKTKSIVFHEP